MASTLFVFVVVQPTKALAASESSQILGFCSYLHENVISYRSSIFQTNRPDRDDWEWDWRNYLVKSEIKFFGGAQCFGWKNSSIEFVQNERAKTTPYIRVEYLDYVPDDTTAYGSSNQSDRTLSRALGIKPSAKQPIARLPTAPSKYVEVEGPNGVLRLSPEVAARNKAAADEYRRKMEEHARAKAEHERKLTLHEQSQANAAAEKRAYEQKLAMNDAQVAGHEAAMAQYKAATTAPAKGAKGWMYCEARGAAGDKRRYYSRIAEVDYVPGQVTITDVMGKNRPAFKSYVAGAHSIFFATDSLLHCPYSTTSLADAEALMARDKRGDGNNGIEIIQTGWTPAN